jgi:hypothetical protein
MAYGKSYGELLHYQFSYFTYFCGVIKELYSFSSQLVKYFLKYCMFIFDRLDLLPFGFKCRLEIIVNIFD